MAELKDSYDVVVIGAGLSGLTCGAYLAKNGVKVLVAEQFNRHGGLATTFEYEGFTFDNGQFGIWMADAAFKTLEELGLKQDIEFTKIDCPLRIIGDGYEYIMGDSPQSVERNLIELFPAEADSIRKFLSKAKAMYIEAKGVLNVSFDLMNPWQKMGFMLFAPFKMPTLLRYMNKYLEDVLGSYFKDSKLKAILLSPGSYNGPGQPALLMLGSCGQAKFYYPKGGIKAIGDLLARGLKKYDGQLVLNTEVNRILIENKQAVGVELGDGRKIKAGFVVSSADARQTFLKLVGEEYLPAKFIKKLNATQIGTSAFLVSLGVNLNLKERGFKGETVICHPKGSSINELLGSDPQKCIVAIYMHSIIEPSQAPAGKSTVQLYAEMPYNLVKDWDAEKEEIARKLIASAEKVIPGLSENIICKHIQTPLTYKQFTPGSEGLGWRPVPGADMMMGQMKRQRTPIKNLFRAGCWTSTAVEMNFVIPSGRTAAQLILKGR